MGRLAIGTSALGNSLGFDVKVFSDAPGPHRIKAWKLVAGKVACGILNLSLHFQVPTRTKYGDCTAEKVGDGLSSNESNSSPRRAQRQGTAGGTFDQSSRQRRARFA